MGSETASGACRVNRGEVVVSGGLACPVDHPAGELVPTAVPLIPWPFLERIRAAQRMGRTVPDASGWALGYERPVSGVVWIWRGVNCHPGPAG
jgi:hypothetical protein